MMVQGDDGTIAYVLQEHKDAPLILCVMGRRSGEFHTFPLSLANASRLAAECSTAINIAIGGVDHAAAVRILMGKNDGAAADA